MTRNFISCPDANVIEAIAAVLACVPKPWTRNMVEDAVGAVVSVADQCRNNQAHEIDADNLCIEFLEDWLGLERNDALLLEIVAE